MRITLLISFLFGLTSAYGQGPPETRCDWEKERSRVSLSSEEQNYPEYIVKLYRSYQYYWKNNELHAFQTDHRITRVTTTNAIERHNRIYIPMRNVVDIVTLRARSINKAGRITNFDEKNLKEILDEDSDNTYRIFAIEGVEVDSEIEFFYTLDVKGIVFESYYFQQETPIRDVSFQLTCPKKMAFDFRVYNDDHKITTDTLNKLNRYQYHREHISGLNHEGFSFYDTYRKRIDFKLAYNFTNSDARLNTWADAGRVFYRSLTKTDKSTEKSLAQFIKSLQDNPGASPESRIKNVEDKIKDNIRKISNSSEPSLDQLTSILKSKQASGEGLTKLLLITYERLGIPVQLVVTCNREYAKFDGSFDSWGFLDEYLLYFPGTNGFLVPGSFELRYPMMTQHLSGHNGLFIEPVTIGNLKTGIPWIKEIPAMPYTADSDNLAIDVRFQGSMENTQIQHQRTFVGYDAADMTPYYNVMSEGKRKEFVEALFKSSIPDLELEKWTVKTATKDLLPSFDIVVNYTTNHFLEKAGPRILFKVGELIGPQSELYREEARQTPIENTHNRGYSRIIRLNIPSGYTVSNLEALNMKVEYKDGEKVPFSFVSSYAQQGDLITITIDEFYKEIYAPLERYEDFRKVVNAAADFNKVTLVLMKK